MSRTVLDLSVPVLSKLSLLLYGAPNVGKTRLLGDAIFHMSSNPDAKIKFINMSGEDGYMSVSGYDIPDGVAETIETLADLTEIINEGPYDLLCLDSLAIVSKLCVAAVTKGVRVPLMTKEKNQWSEIHLIFETLLRRLLSSSTFFLTTTHAQMHEDPITGETRISPEFEGAKQTLIVKKMFDMIAYLTASTNAKGVVDRRILVKPMAKGTKDAPGVVTKQRLTRTITEDIAVPEGDGVFEKFITIIKAHV